jgi:HEPN domain-containing protein
MRKEVERWFLQANGVPFMLYDEKDAKEALGYAREVVS